MQRAGVGEAQCSGQEVVCSVEAFVVPVQLRGPQRYDGISQWAAQYGVEQPHPEPVVIAEQAHGLLDEPAGDLITYPSP